MVTKKDKEEEVLNAEIGELDDDVVEPTPEVPAKPEAVPEPEVPAKPEAVVGAVQEAVAEGVQEVVTEGVQAGAAPAGTPQLAVPAWAQQLMEEVKVLRADNEMFRQLAGKSKLLDFADAQKDFTKKFVNLKKWDNKLVVGWEDLDYSEFDAEAKNARAENVYTTLIHPDGSKSRVNYVDWYSSSDVVQYQIKQFNGDLEGVTTIEGIDGNTISIKTKFLNQ